MIELEIRQLIAKGEGYHVEFKREDENNDDFAKTIVSFANSDGGKILVGVDDDGTIIGVNDVDKFMSRIDDVAFNSCKPPVTIFQETTVIDDKNIVIINVPKGIQRPYQFKGKFYIRSSNRCREATREEILRLFQSSESIYYDELSITSAILEDIDLESFKLFLKDYMSLDIIPIDEQETLSYLKNLHLADKDFTPTVTGILFFGKKPQYFLPEARIICAYIEGDDISIAPSDKKDINGVIPKMIKDTEQFFKIYLKEKHVIKDFEPETKFEIPMAALREAVVNAIAHRDYTISGPIRILIFTNRVEIRSPGKLPNTVTIDSIRVGGSHVLRNPHIYNMLAKFGFVTNLGSGVRRMIKLVKDYTGFDVELIANENEFIVIIPRKIM
jgi:ATP-dependent DNA helicase RecG